MKQRFMTRVSNVASRRARNLFAWRTHLSTTTDLKWRLTPFPVRERADRDAALPGNGACTAGRDFL